MHQILIASILGLGLVILMTNGQAFAESGKATFTVAPDFPDPRLIEIPQLTYENGMLVVDKLQSDSRIDLIFENKEIINDSSKTSFSMTKVGCYWVEEESHYSATDSNKVCRNSDGTITIEEHPFKNWVEKRVFSDLGNGVTLILLPVQEDLRFASACPQHYSETLQACYRNSDDKKFVIATLETISPFVIEHELKHAECDCDYHD